MADYPINLKQGVDFLLPLTVRNPSTDGGVTPGTPIDLTGATAQGGVFKGYKAPLFYPFVFTFDADPTTGQLSAALPAALVTSCPYGLYRFELKVLGSTGLTIFFLEGPATLEAGNPNG